MSATNESRELSDRIFESFPVTQPAFAKLLGLMDIVASRNIATACVSLGGRSRMMINPDFVERRCHTAFDLSMLVLHELYHVVLGHTRLYSHITPAQNWACDAVINAQLSQLFPSPSETALFRRCYRADAFPECLLRPPEGWRMAEETWHLKGTAGDVHRALYTDNSVSYEDLFRLLDNALAGADGDGQWQDLDQSRLLGNHDGNDEANDPELLKEIRNIIAQWPMLHERSGRDLGDNLERRQLTLQRRHNAAVSMLRRALTRLAGTGMEGALSPIRTQTPAESVLPYRSMLDRRAEVLACTGNAPLFFRAESSLSGLARSERVHVYVDVSGSMSGVVKALYEALVTLLDHVAPTIHLFSTAVSDISHGQLKKGVLDTTGGTSIDVVTSHILKTKVKKALIVTDGWVGSIPSSHVEKLNKARVKVHGVITSPGEATFLAPIHGRAWQLPALV
ncbi:MAG: hypothetical protein NTV11_10195 [Rhodocyclales bacterium]|nr:hypothetical protein [Rhodocyclales bacterium]